MDGWLKQSKDDMDGWLNSLKIRWLINRHVAFLTD